MQSRVGPGRFQWNTGGWFGTQLGSTVWLILAPVLFGGLLTLFHVMERNAVKKGKRSAELNVGPHTHA